MTNSDSIPNNPAGRLRALTDRMHALNPKKANSWRRVDEAWGELLDVDPSNRSVLLARLGRAMRLPELAENAVRQASSLDPAIYLEWVGSVRGAFSVMNLEAPWRDIHARLDQASLKSLAFCDDQLSKLRPEPIVDLDQISSLQATVRSLIDEIESAENIAAEFKNFFLDKLHLVDEALTDYRFFGLSPLSSAFESLVGASLLNEEIYKQTKETEHGRKFWDAMGRLSTLISIFSGTAKLAELGFTAVKAVIQE